MHGVPRKVFRQQLWKLNALIFLNKADRGTESRNNRASPFHHCVPF